MTVMSDERRRVAEALREMETPTWPTLTEAVMGHAATRDKVVGRLAELVDPIADVPDYCPRCGARLLKGDEDGDR